MPIDALPPNPQPTDSRATFTSKMFAWIAALTNWTTQANALEANVNTKEASATAAASNAQDSAAQAQGAAAAAGAVKWVAGANYNVGDPVYSPTNLQTYRCSVAGVSNTDPANDSAHWNRVLFAAGATAGGTAQPPGNVTLTKDSTGAQSVSFNAYGQAVKLPDATTMQSGSFLFSIQNTGTYPGVVVDATNAPIAFLEPGASCDAGLVDNSTAAGAWTVRGGTPAGIIASLSNPNLGVTQLGNEASLTYSTMGSIPDAFQMGAVVCIVGAYGIVMYDPSTRTFGTAWVSSYQMNVSKIDDTHLLVAYVNGSTLCARVLTITGTTITANAEATAAGTHVGPPNVIALSATAAVIGCWYGSYPYSLRVVAVSIAGTTVTIGAAGVTPSGVGTMTGTGTVALVRASDTVALCAAVSSSGGITSTTFFAAQVSGVNVTTGTTGGGSYWYLPYAQKPTDYFCALDNGAWLVAAINQNDNNLRVGVIRISGADVSMNSTQPGATVAAGFPYRWVKAAADTGILQISTNGSPFRGFYAARNTDAATGLSVGGQFSPFPNASNGPLYADRALPMFKDSAGAWGFLHEYVQLNDNGKPPHSGLMLAKATLSTVTLTGVNVPNSEQTGYVRLTNPENFNGAHNFIDYGSKRYLLGESSALITDTEGRDFRHVRTSRLRIKPSHVVIPAYGLAISGGQFGITIVGVAK